MRVYVPLTLPALEAAHTAGELRPGGGPGPERNTVLAYAVTSGLREWHLSDDLEELEYTVLHRAARASLRLLAADQRAQRRRVVVAADVRDSAVTPASASETDPVDLGEVHVPGAIPLSKVAAVHADEPAAERDVAAAAQVVQAADQGDGDAEFTVGGADAHELLWYATQEIPTLLA